jgi:hypothetical protein
MAPPKIVPREFVWDGNTSSVMVTFDSETGRACMMTPSKKKSTPAEANQGRFWVLNNKAIGMRL